MRERTIAHYQPEVALVDIGLPGMDGYEVAQRLRAQRGDGAPVLVALTGYGQDADREASAEAGFRHPLAKPVGAEEIDRILAALR